MWRDLLLPIVIAVTMASGCSAAPSTPGGGTGPGGPDDPGPPAIEPDAFATGDVDVVTVIRTKDERKPISPLIYGINNLDAGDELPADVMSGITFVRRGGDRCNAYNWETNLSTSSVESGVTSDMYLVEKLPADEQSAPAGLDLSIIRADRAGNRGTMVPFVLHGYVASQAAGTIPYEQGGWDRNDYFHRVGLVKPSPFSTTPDLNDNTVYTDEHFDFMKRQFPQEDIYAPGPKQVMVGIDNEPDLYAYNFPMLQDGGGEPLLINGTKVGTRVTGTEFTKRFIDFAKRIKELSPQANIIGPSHYHFDGFTTWHGSMLSEYSDTGRWYMDDFLKAVKAAGEASGKRLLDTWDFHWYPQHKDGEKFVWDLDDSVRPLTATEIDHILQGPRAYWDTEYDEDSWITKDSLQAPTFIVSRLQKHIAEAYPGTQLGVSEYFPGGCGHIASGLAVADTLGVFARMGVHLAAMWQTCKRLEFAFGGIKLLRNADGKGAVRFADTVVKVEHPEKAETSVYAGSDEDAKRVTVLVINKTNTARRVGVRAFHTTNLGAVDIYRIDAEHASPHLAKQDKLAKKNAYAYASPPLSASLLVFH
jgi:mannan endo-1,4-beta-mannosidase